MFVHANLKATSTKTDSKALNRDVVKLASLSNYNETVKFVQAFSQRNLDLSKVDVNKVFRMAFVQLFIRTRNSALRRNLLNDFRPALYVLKFLRDLYFLQGDSLKDMSKGPYAVTTEESAYYMHLGLHGHFLDLLSLKDTNAF